MYALLKITEVTEVTRDLSTEERCMLSVAYANYGGCIDEDYRKAAKDRLAEIGFVQYVNQQKTRGRFRNTTPERRATEVETIAWLCTQILKQCCDMDGECANCPKRGGCEASSDYNKSLDILAGKTISVEYFEE